MTRTLLPVLLALTAACAGLPDLFREPEIELQQVMLRSIGVRGGDLDLVVQVYNPNRFALQGTQLRLGFDVEGSHVGDVTYDAGYVVQQGDTAQITLPLRFEWAGMTGAVRTALSQGQVPYTMRGEARLDTPIGARTVSFTRSGQVPLIQQERHSFAN